MSTHLGHCQQRNLQHIPRETKAILMKSFLSFPQLSTYFPLLLLLETISGLVSNCVCTCVCAKTGESFFPHLVIRHVLYDRKLVKKIFFPIISTPSSLVLLHAYRTNDNLSLSSFLFVVWLFQFDRFMEARAERGEEERGKMEETRKMKLNCLFFFNIARSK